MFLISFCLVLLIDEVANIHEANSLLEALGYSYKSYQEKERISYQFQGHEIDIDTWPGIPTYFEVEGTSEQGIIVFNFFLSCSVNRLSSSKKSNLSLASEVSYLTYFGSK